MSSSVGQGIAPKHPAKFSDIILAVIDDLLPKEGLLLDDFAGVGRIHSLGRTSFGVEIEPEWAMQHPQNIVGNALSLPFADDTFDMAACSATYANRMGDKHNAKDVHKKCEGKGCAACWYRGVTLRHTYKHYLNRDLHPENTGGFNWGNKYRELHVGAWTDLSRVLKPSKPFVLNLKNHYRRHKLIDVIQFHKDTLDDLGFVFIEERFVDAPGQRHGKNGDLRVETESVLLFLNGAK